MRSATAATAGPPSVELRNVYVHAPFCARRCFYCDFAVSVRSRAEAQPWLRALELELRHLARTDALTLGPTLDTLYLGGGTPSLLGGDAVAGLRDLLGPERITASTEFTAEANPESFTPEIARAWARGGLSRLSLGTQSFQEPVLRWMGRTHGAEGARRAVRTARDVGLDDLSVDLIFGLPDDVPRDWAQDLDDVLRLDAPHVSLYGLTAEAGTPLGRGVAEGRIRMPSEERYADEYRLAHERLLAAGYEHYEVSNFARPGHRSRHNSHYWGGGSWLGLGNGAHSFIASRRQRRWNVRSWERYETLLIAGDAALDDAETIDDAAARLESVWLGLRTENGLTLEPRFTAGDALVRRWVAEDWAHEQPWRDARRIVLTVEGWLRLDRLAVELESRLDGSFSG